MVRQQLPYKVEEFDWRFFSVILLTTHITHVFHKNFNEINRLFLKCWIWICNSNTLTFSPILLFLDLCINCRCRWETTRLCFIGADPISSTWKAGIVPRGEESVPAVNECGVNLKGSILLTFVGRPKWYMQHHMACFSNFLFLCHDLKFSRLSEESKSFRL